MTRNCRAATLIIVSRRFASPALEGRELISSCQVPGGPRLLLRRLREIMAEPVGAQDRLDKIVTQIAANMVAEVCSVYVMRGDGARTSPPRA